VEFDLLPGGSGSDTNGALASLESAVNDGTATLTIGGTAYRYVANSFSYTAMPITTANPEKGNVCHHVL